MPQVTTTQSGQTEAYGSAANENQLLFRERLMRRFAAHEYVRVMNVDDETFIWQYLPAHAEDFEYTPDPMKITRRGEPEVWQLDAGQSEAIVGENAFVMIEGLYKKLVAKKKIADTPDQQATVARNFSFSDGAQQEKWIDQILLGKEAPSFASNIEKDLGIDSATVNAAKELVGSAHTKN